MAQPANTWTPSSWRSKTLAQPVDYPDQAHLDRVVKKLKTVPPLVTPSEIERLRVQLKQVEAKQAFLLHAGDCAESFEACTHENITAKIGLILSFSLILIWGSRLPVVRIGRIAGQYAKPRSSPFETVDGKKIPSFRGDNVNDFSTEGRTPDPERLLSAYFYSSATLNYIRSLLASGYASLNNPREWSLSHVQSPVLKAEFERVSDSLADALEFSQTIGAETAGSYEAGGKRGVLGEVDFFVSHEGLMLNYEEALTRRLPIPAGSISRNPPPTPSRSLSFDRGDPARNTSAPAEQSPDAYYNTSAHFVWVGDRTRQLDGAHIEYFRGIRNPIGIKVGPSMKGTELVELLDIVNPGRESGKVTLITRYGAGKVADHLPGHIQAVRESEHPVIWVCDPMHGNTETSSTGHKTRHFSNIVQELTSALSIHTLQESVLGGVSLEFTGEIDERGFSVTECLGGSMGLAESELPLRYQTFCDPRLNFEQSLDLAFLVSNYLKTERRSQQDTRGRRLPAAADLLAELRKPAKAA